MITAHLPGYPCPAQGLGADCAHCPLQGIKGGQKCYVCWQPVPLHDSAVVNIIKRDKKTLRTGSKCSAVYRCIYVFVFVYRLIIPENSNKIISLYLE